MNIFKNVFKVKMVLALLFLYSCEKEQSDLNNNTLTDEIEKVETQYKEGDIKIETSAIGNYKEMMLQELEKSYSKQTTYLKNAGKTVGVLKNGSCGSYKELIVFMDCEDTGNQSEKYGDWVGDSDVDSNGNITLRFCCVYGAYFEQTNVDYAVLALTGSSNWPTGVSRILNEFDNENNQNANQFTLNGIEFSGSFWNSYTTMSDNVIFEYYYYPSVSSSTPFPNLGISYGVFGSFGNSQGRIYSDDEDDSNGNCIFKQIWSSNQLPPVTLVASVPNIIDSGHNGKNTNLYMSKVN